MVDSTMQSSNGPVPLFRAEIRPYRSLGRDGFLILMSVIGAVSFAAGMAFAAMGAWPVLGFFGLDVALIYVAFRRNYGDARQVEIIEIADQMLTLTQLDRRGRPTVLRYNPVWVRLAVSEAPNGSVALQFVSHGTAAAFGGFLNDEQKLGLAARLDAALFAVRRGARW